MLKVRCMKWLVLFVATVLLVGCGGSNTSSSLTDKELAVEKILSYVRDGGDRPTLQDYTDVTVSGVNVSNLDDINDYIATLTPEDVDTVEEIQAYADELGITIDLNPPVFVSDANISVDEILWKLLP